MDPHGEAAPYSRVITQLWLAVSDLVGPGERDEFARFERSFTWLPPETRGEGTIPATLRAMTDDEAERLAQKVVELLSRTLDAAYHHEDPR